MDTNKTMKNEMKENEMEQVNGGDFIDDVKDVLNKLNPFKTKNPFDDIKDPFAPGMPKPNVPDFDVAHTK